jgi:dihydroorotate dehydrogenase
MYQQLLKPLLFRLDAETAHQTAMRLYSGAMKIPGADAVAKVLYNRKSANIAVKLWGLDFPSPVGLAAGFDKDALHVDALAYLGFGFIEVGTLTPRPQAGNPQPRLFRLPADEALINRMGFNNGGSREAALRLAKRKTKLVIGGNIGKNKTTPNANAAEDYIEAFKDLYPVVDYFVVNVSSPNTPGLRELQEREPLTKLLQQLQQLNRQYPVQKPLLLKIAPDLTEPQLGDILGIAEDVKLDGLIATNTTTDRSRLTTSKKQVELLGAGGVSGAPLRKRSNEIIRYITERAGKDLPVIGVGGISEPQHALEKLQAGCRLVQVYTGFIYQGPGFIRAINSHLAENQ